MTRLVPVGDSSVEVTIVGSGALTFIATHPFQGGGEGPGPLLTALGEVGTAIGVMPRGLGRSVEEDPDRMGLKQLVDDLESVRVELAAGRWIFVGQSGGGFVALAYALTYPGSVSALILSCTTSMHEMESDSVYHPANPNNAEMSKAMAEGRRRDAWAYIAHRPDLLSEDRGEFSPHHQQAFRREVGDFRLTERLSEISVPTLVLTGRYDGAIPPRYGRALADSITGAQHVEFESSGHFPYEEEPGRFREVVRGFATRLGS